ncbi:MAG: anaerobic ribonucleoside-triphosphate reductase activating protein [bacterium]|nr:anaerobic ribonucleoside-triphosphate reductase activating protein [bacterium]
MEISKVQGISLIDYPDKLSCLLFLSGCNLACPFCQNPDLVNGEKNGIDYTKAIEDIEKRKRFIDGVVITGGEPTIHSDLHLLCKKIKEMGLAVKVDTNGYLLEPLKGLVSEGIVDYIALDIKASLSNYKKACGKEVGGEKIRETIEFLKSSKIEYELRTTCVPTIIDEEEIEKIGREIQGARRWFLQQFQNKKTLDPNFMKIMPYCQEYLFGLKEIAKRYIEKIEIRGM